ncbi:MAG: hypothetical protein QOF01_2737 [Thermomicrobiales bacterium]|nr:hypothetical protein [Thermomicrobiales bacterium]MEA2596268.1 hypothetical protein [Thermomicrobiales bacterium]
MAEASPTARDDPRLDRVVPPAILVVDDERDIADALTDLLFEEGYAVCTAYDGQEALRLVRAEPPDLVLSDVMMPKVNGPALIQRLRRDGYHLPVILMSAVYADVDLPGVRFIAKPFNLDHVLSVVERVLADGIG